MVVGVIAFIVSAAMNWFKKDDDNDDNNDNEETDWRTEEADADADADAGPSGNPLAPSPP